MQPVVGIGISALAIVGAGNGRVRPASEEYLISVLNNQIAVGTVDKNVIGSPTLRSSTHLGARAQIPAVIPLKPESGTTKNRCHYAKTP